MLKQERRGLLTDSSTLIIGVIAGLIVLLIRIVDKQQVSTKLHSKGVLFWLLPVVYFVALNISLLRTKFTESANKFADVAIQSRNVSAILFCWGIIKVVWYLAEKKHQNVETTSESEDNNDNKSYTLQFRQRLYGGVLYMIAAILIYSLGTYIYPLI